MVTPEAAAAQTSRAKAGAWLDDNHSTCGVILSRHGGVGQPTLTLHKRRCRAAHADAAQAAVVKAESVVTIVAVMRGAWAATVTTRARRAPAAAAAVAVAAASD